MGFFMVYASCLGRTAAFQSAVNLHGRSRRLIEQVEKTCQLGLEGGEQPVQPGRLVLRFEIRQRAVILQDSVVQPSRIASQCGGEGTHGVVLCQHLATESADSLTASGLHQLLKQPTADTHSLKIVGYDYRQFGDIRVGCKPNAACRRSCME